MVTSSSYTSHGSVEVNPIGNSAAAPVYEIEHGFFPGNLALRLYEVWAAAEGLNLLTNGQTDQNPDGDLLDNILEYAFGLDPLVNDNSALTLNGLNLISRGVPAVYSAPAGNTLDFRAAFLRRADYVEAGLTYTVQFSGDMTHWYNAAPTPLPQVEDMDGEMDLATLAYPLFILTSNGVEKAKFFRLLITFSPQ